MGISGLLPALSDYTTSEHVSCYRNKTVAIDAYVWLHRALFYYATEICLTIPTNKYTSYFENRIKLLQSYEITPFFVFDGALLPSKSYTEIKITEIKA